MIERKNRTEEIIINILKRGSSKDNSGTIIHNFFTKSTKNFQDFQELAFRMQQLLDISVFAGCREYLKMQVIANNEHREQLLYLLENDIKELVINKIRDEIVKGIDLANNEKCSEIIIAYYTIEDYKGCNDFLYGSEYANRYFHELVQLCEADLILSEYILDLVIFLLESVKNNDDLWNSKYIRSLKIHPQKVEFFIKDKNNELSELARCYFENEQYMSLSALMRMLEIFVSDEGAQRSKVYEYIGIKKEDFQKKAFTNGSARALELYFWVEYYRRFPALDEIMYILEKGTTSSTYAIIHQCFRKIKEEGVVSDNIKKILSWIKNNVKDENIRFEYYDEGTDPGIDNKLLRLNITQIFQLLCRNKEDVYEFLNLVSFCNIFYNEQLRLDYKVVWYEKSRYVQWEQEYKYVCQKYESKRKIASVIMNSYLRFFVDIEDLFKKYGNELDKFWFAGYETNDGRFRLFQEDFNEKYNRKGYKIFRVSKKDNYPEENRYVRFLIRGIDHDKKRIYITENKSMSQELSRHINRKVREFLCAGDIKKTYQYLINYDNADSNLSRRDKFVTISKSIDDDDKNRGIKFAELFAKNKEQYREYIWYIYANSRIREYVSLDKMREFICAQEYLLGDIRIEDNRNSNNSEYIYISPNYYNESGILYYIPKRYISKELLSFIHNQLEIFSKVEEAGNTIKNKNVRVCFYLKDSNNDEKNELSKLNLSCCDIEIDNLTILAETYYTKIYKSNRKGIANNILKGYMRSYNRCLRENGYNEEWYAFFSKYFEFMYNNIYEIYESRCTKIISYKKDEGINFYYVIQECLLKGAKLEAAVIEYIKKDINYIRTMKTLKSCYEKYNSAGKKSKHRYSGLIKDLYSHTLFHNIFGDKSEFEESIKNAQR